jgi:hypothetical protein
VLWAGCRAMPRLHAYIVPPGKKLRAGGFQLGPRGCFPRGHLAP